MVEFFTSLADLKSWPFPWLFQGYADQLQEVSETFVLDDWLLGMEAHGFSFKLGLLIVLGVGWGVFWACGQRRTRSWSDVVDREIWSWRWGLLATMACLFAWSVVHVVQIANEHLTELEVGGVYYVVESFNLWACFLLPTILLYWVGGFLVSMVLEGLPNGTPLKGRMMGLNTEKATAQQKA